MTRPAPCTSPTRHGGRSSIATPSRSCARAPQSALGAASTCRRRPPASTGAAPAAPNCSAQPRSSSRTAAGRASSTPPRANPSLCTRTGLWAWCAPRSAAPPASPTWGTCSTATATTRPPTPVTASIPSRLRWRQTTQCNSILLHGSTRLVIAVPPSVTIAAPAHVRSSARRGPRQARTRRKLAMTEHDRHTPAPSRAPGRPLFGLARGSAPWLLPAFALVVAAFVVPGLLLLAIPAGALALAMVWFFRDPERTAAGAGLACAADGVVQFIDAQPDGGTRVAVFMNPLNVHVNRAPLAGVVTAI